MDEQRHCYDKPCFTVTLDAVTITAGGRVMKEVNSLTKLVLRSVGSERKRQDEKWGVQNHQFGQWLSIIGEEYGEMCKAYNEGNFKQLEIEAIQTAACCVAFVEHICRLSGVREV